MQRKSARRAHESRARVQPGLIRITTTGLFGGALASLLGIGGAFISVPLMTRFVAVPRTIGKAATLSIPMALAGVAGSLLGGTPDECREACAGHIYLPAVAAIGITAVLTAPLGARLTHVLPVNLMRRLFALFLIAAAAQLAYKFSGLGSGFEHGRLFLARLMTPATTGLPVAAEAPAWLSAGVSDARLALVAQYGPRRAFLVLARADEAGAAGFFFLAATPKPEDWRIKRAGVIAADKSDAKQAPKIEAAGAATVVTPALPERNTRKSLTTVKRQRRRNEPAADQLRQPRPGQQSRPALKLRGPGPDARNAQSAVTDPFGFLTAPGAGRTEDWSN